MRVLNESTTKTGPVGTKTRQLSSEDGLPFYSHENSGLDAYNAFNFWQTFAFVRLLLACKAEGGNDVWGALKRMWLSCQMGNIGELPPKFACISPLLFSSGTTRSCYISKCCSYDQYSQYIM
ncbi:hypothetical protein Y032_0010g959 [Ancylostoma ceylanicum]|uniref:Uncharacterized protein n=1 Tax=Ancylostoma ceylanicum TaxID=53326 RepID=A0A016VHJ6_9BILA|nr:hypothetical protein Y032_0010g959 [Ancylostoma ceylanicum]